MPRTDERWKRFYSKFIVVDQNEDDEERRTFNERFSPVPTLVALIFLAQGSTDVKAKAICELFSET